MFERILMPLDGSEMAEMALPYGEELARSLGSKLILFHVLGQEHMQEYEHIHKMYLERLAETVERNIRNDQPNGKKEGRVTIKVNSGEPAENICNLVEKTDVDLVIMAAVSASGLKVGKMLGSVADHVCRTVPIPVMLIRPQGIKQDKRKKRLINHILLPLDGSDLSKLALPVGAELADKLHARITLFQMAHKIRIVDDGSGFSAYIDYSKMDQDEENRVQAEMIVLEKALGEKGLSASNVVAPGFDAADKIIETGKQIEADLVIMSTHGRSGLGRWVFGNVAEKVLRHGETPVLFVHARAG
ncbi:MAG: universal stress protein [Dehalococcoidia bacterium]|nr:universal stress protein [Dehalococcoidia bacterium]